MGSLQLGLPPMHQSPGPIAGAGARFIAGTTAASELSSSPCQVMDVNMLPPLSSSYAPLDAARLARLDAAARQLGPEVKPLVYDSCLYDIPGAPHSYNLEDGESSFAAPGNAANGTVLHARRDSRPNLPDPPPLGVFLHDVRVRTAAPRLPP